MENFSREFQRINTREDIIYVKERFDELLQERKTAIGFKRGRPPKPAGQTKSSLYQKKYYQEHREELLAKQKLYYKSRKKQNSQIEKTKEK